MPSGTRETLVQELLHSAKVLREAGCLPATDGNFSARLDNQHVILTSRGIEKRSLTEWDFIEVPLNEDQPVEGSTEWQLHRALYQSRADVNCVLHVHAPGLTAFAAAHALPAIELLAEAFLTVGKIVLVPFAKPGSPELGETLMQAHADAMIYLLSNHGAVAVGNTVRETLHRLERAEFLARVQISAAALGGPQPLTAEQLTSLQTS